MIRVTRKELAAWIMTQPDDREVEFRQNRSHMDCGCVMMQYAKDNVPETTYCGLYDFRNDDDQQLGVLDTEYFTFWPGASIIKFPGQSRFTYKEIKEHVRSLGLV
jgi:hypothetical protein